MGVRSEAISLMFLTGGLQELPRVGLKASCGSSSSYFLMFYVSRDSGFSSATGSEAMPKEIRSRDKTNRNKAHSPKLSLSLISITHSINDK